MKRFALVLLAIAMLLSLAAVAEELETEEIVMEEVEEPIDIDKIVEVEDAEEATHPAAPATSIMYVADCDAVSVLAAADYSSEVLTRVYSNMPVEVTGDVVTDGKYWFYPVKVEQLGTVYEGYANVEFFAEDRLYVHNTGLIIAEDAKGNECGVWSHTEPYAAAERIELIPTRVVLEIEYYASNGWAYVSAVRHGVKEELGFVAVNGNLLEVPGKFTIMNAGDYVKTFMFIDAWNTIR